MLQEVLNKLNASGQKEIKAAKIKNLSKRNVQIKKMIFHKQRKSKRKF